eukprot:gene22946-35172_t
MSCCPTKEAPAAKSVNEITKQVEEYYGKVLGTASDLKTTACSATARPHRLIVDIIKKLPDQVNDKFFGCGCPLPLGIEGLSVLDLGSGSGRDCYVCAALVGESGKVTGIDMTPEQLALAREHAETFTKDVLGYKKCNMEYLHGYIEKFPEAIQDGSYDLIISNCVVNLSPDKPSVLREAYRALKEGGEMYFSDLYCDRRLPQHVKNHEKLGEVLWGEGLSGALYINDFHREAHKVGFTDPRELTRDEVKVLDPELQALVGNAKFYSIMYRLFKLPGVLETRCEDYGQFAVYKGTIPGHQHSYKLDDHHVLVTGKPFLVCGNTAAMLGGKSWLAKHFTVTGDRSVHYGMFDTKFSPPAAGGVSSAASSRAKP